jgi:hypothetical protein
VTGRPPFEGDDPLTIAFKHVNETAQPPRKVRPGVPRDWEALILKMLAKDPAQRFQTAAALETAIAELSTDDSRKAASTQPRPLAQEQTPAPRRSLLRVLTPPPRHDADMKKVVGGEAMLPLPHDDGEGIAEAPAIGGPRIQERVLHLLSAHHLVSAGAAVVLLALAAIWLVRGSQSSGPPAHRTPIAIFEAQPSGTFQNPDGVALDRQGNVYVVDQTTDRIQKLFFDPTRGAVVPLAQWGGHGNGPGRFSGPAAVAVDRQGNMYVTDTNNSRIQKLSPTGQPVAQWGQPGAAPGQFSNPFGIALDGKGNIYVADNGNHRIQKF